jgi:hypothetical protein
MSLIRGSPAVSGWACSWPSRCALCCAGRKSISWWMRKATGGRPGKSHRAKEAGKSGRCGIAAANGTVQASILALPVRHPDHPEQPLWLVIARRKGGLPWYLLTNEPITCAQDAWGIMFAYARRWQIELTWRENKSELAFQSPRLWHWEPREKLLLLATLAYAFLLTLLAPFYEPLRRWVLRRYCHRTGRHCRRAHAPFARLRLALSRLWQTFPPRLREAFWPLPARHLHHACLTIGPAARADEALPGQGTPGLGCLCFQLLRQKQQPCQNVKNREKRDARGSSTSRSDSSRSAEVLSCCFLPLCSFP